MERKTFLIHAPAGESVTFKGPTGSKRTHTHRGDVSQCTEGCWEIRFEEGRGGGGCRGVACPSGGAQRLRRRRRRGSSLRSNCRGASGRRRVLRRWCWCARADRQTHHRPPQLNFAFSRRHTARTAPARQAQRFRLRASCRPQATGSNPDPLCDPARVNKVGARTTKAPFLFRHTSQCQLANDLFKFCPLLDKSNSNISKVSDLRFKT